MIFVVRSMLCIIAMLQFTLSYAAVCPEPNNSSLVWGEIPPPWKVSPFSPNTPQGEDGTQFVKANILAVGLTHGAACTYRNSSGEYTIWWEVRVKRPARTENNWYETLGGYECSRSIVECLFYPSQAAD